MEEPNSFETNIFINCPFDDEYKPLLRPLIFTCLYCGLNPQIAQTINAGQSRLENIIKLIKQSKYSIHDISRIAITKEDGKEYARFNMPFELGIDLGVRNMEDTTSEKKVALVIDTQPYRYHKTLSDLSGSDISCYGEDKETQPYEIVKVLRDWFTVTIAPNQYAAKRIWKEFNEFIADLSRILMEINGMDIDIQELTVTEFISYAEEWVKERPNNTTVFS